MDFLFVCARKNNNWIENFVSDVVLCLHYVVKKKVCCGEESKRVWRAAAAA